MTFGIHSNVVFWAMYSTRVSWSRTYKTTGSNGQFEVRVSSRYLDRATKFKAEAEGYLPAISKIINFDNPEVVEFRMKSSSW